MSNSWGGDEREQQLFLSQMRAQVERDHPPEHVRVRNVPPKVTPREILLEEDGEVCPFCGYEPLPPRMFDDRGPTCQNCGATIG